VCATRIQGDKEIVGSEVLKVVDNDTTPSGLIYKVTAPATNGHLAFVDRPQRDISTFTQQDIDSRRVVFLQNGSREPGAIYLEAGIIHEISRPKRRLIVAGPRLRPNMQCLPTSVSPSVRPLSSFVHPVGHISKTKQDRRIITIQNTIGTAAYVATFSSSPAARPVVE